MLCLSVILPTSNFQFLRKHICSLGQSAASHGRPIHVQPEHKVAASWMAEQQLASLTESGRLVLQSSALIFATKLAGVQKVKEPEDPRKRSLWSLRRQIMAEGWTRARSGRHASVEQKLFNPKSEFPEYYAILLHSCFACWFV